MLPPEPLAPCCDFFRKRHGFFLFETSRKQCIENASTKIPDIDDKSQAKIKENTLANIIGTKTPGRLTSRSAFKIGEDYRLVLPVAAYQSWKGIRIEGKGVRSIVRR